MRIVKKRLKLTPKTKEYLKSLPKIYLVVRYAKWGVQEYCFSGKFTNDYEPLVYLYDDFNGEREPAYYLRRISYATCGEIWSYYEDYENAKNVADSLNNPESDLVKFFRDRLGDEIVSKYMVEVNK